MTTSQQRKAALVAQGRCRQCGRLRRSTGSATRCKRCLIVHRKAMQQARHRPATATARGRAHAEAREKGKLV